MLQISAKPRAMLIAATMMVAAANSAAAQNGISIDYEDRIYIRWADRNRYFIAPQSSQNWPAGRSGSSDDRVAFMIKNDPNTPGKPIRHYDIVALETTVTTHPGYVRAYCSAKKWLYFDSPKGLGEAPEQWWRILRQKGEGVVEQGDVVYLQNRYDANLHLSCVQDPTWLTCPTNQCPLVLELVNPKAPTVVVSQNPRGDSSDIVTDVVFVENPGSGSTQSLSQTWSLSETQSAQIGESSTNNWEVGLTVSQEFDAKFFKGSVELSASYGQALTKERSQVMESNVQKSVTGTYSAPPRGWAFHIVRINIPYKVYDATSQGITLQMRKFNGQLSASKGRIIEIPNRDENGAIVPVQLADLQSVLQIYAAKDPEEVREILIPGGLLQQWQAKGFVTGGSYTPPSPMPSPLPSPSPSPIVQLNVASVPGIYQRNPVQDAWHKGRITVGPNNNLVWTNEGGRSWSLVPDLANRALRTGADNPYVNDGIRDFTLESNGANVTGFRFNDELYTRVGDAGPAPNPNPMPLPVPVPQLTREAVLGSYERTPVEDPWHQGKISAGANGTLQWTNSAGVRWTLTPDLANKMLRTGADNPYANDGIRDFTIETSGGQITGFRFNGELYRRLP